MRKVAGTLAGPYSWGEVWRLEKPCPLKWAVLVAARGFRAGNRRLGCAGAKKTCQTTPIVHLQPARMLFTLPGFILGARLTKDTGSV